MVDRTYVDKIKNMQDNVSLMLTEELLDFLILLCKMWLNKKDQIH